MPPLPTGSPPAVAGSATSGFPFASAEARRHQTAKALCALVGVILVGTLGFVIIEEWSVWRSLYFTLITITTVGYGDEGISENGEKFASLLLIGGIAVASYCLAVVVQAAVANQLAWRRRMQKRIDRLRNHVIVCGYGRMGQTVCAELAGAGIAFVVVERDAEQFQKACEDGCLVVEGSAGEDETLLAAGVERAHHIVATVNAEAENVVITLSARVLAPEIQIIARAEGDEEVRKLVRAGSNRTVSPYRSGGVEIADLITRPMVADFLAHSSMSGGSVALAEVRIREGSSLVGRTLADYGRAEGSRVSFVALEHAGEGVKIPPGGSETFAPGDRLMVAGDPGQIAKMQDGACASASAA